MATQYENNSGRRSRSGRRTTRRHRLKALPEVNPRKAGAGGTFRRFFRVDLCRRLGRFRRPSRARGSWPIPLLLPHPLLPFHHDSSQYPVDSRLIARAFGLEPVHHFNIHAQRDSPLSRPVPARLRARFSIRQQQQVVFHRRVQVTDSHPPAPCLLPLCFLGLNCHDVIVHPMLS